MAGPEIKNRKIFAYLKCWIFLISAVAFVAAGAAMAEDGDNVAVPPIPTPGVVTMVDLGAHKCIPCKMMQPIITALQKEYEGRASIIFIDVWQHREQGRKYGIRGIPTQIFYDKSGKEVRRHVGFMDKKSIVAIFDQLGVPGKAGQ